MTLTEEQRKQRTRAQLIRALHESGESVQDSVKLAELFS